MYRIINTAENFGKDEWFVNESDREFEAIEDAESAVKHLNSEYETDTFGIEEIDRIDIFFESLREDLLDDEIAAGLTSGDIETPKWLSISEDTDHLKAWDNENGGSSQMGFYTIKY